jgi:hypothetical protein
MKDKYNINMGQWQYDIDKCKVKYAEKNLTHCHFVHNKSHVDWPGNKPGPSG